MIIVEFFGVVPRPQMAPIRFFGVTQIDIGSLSMFRKAENG